MVDRLRRYLTHMRYVDAEEKLHAWRISPHPSHAVSSAHVMASGISSSVTVGGREKTSEYLWLARARPRHTIGRRLRRQLNSQRSLTGQGVPRAFGVGDLARLKLAVRERPIARKMQTQLVSQANADTELDPRARVCRVLPAHEEDEALDQANVALAEPDRSVDDRVRMRQDRAVQWPAEEFGGDAEQRREEDGRRLAEVGERVHCRQPDTGLGLRYGSSVAVIGLMCCMYLASERRRDKLTVRGESQPRAMSLVAG